jgi:hypothetical protein
MPYVDKYKGIYLEPLECAVRGLDPEDGTPMEGYSADSLKELHWPGGAPMANAQPEGQKHRDEVLYRMALIDYYFTAPSFATAEDYDQYARKYVKERR